MKIILVLLIIPFLSSTECGKKKKKSSVSEQQSMNVDSLPVCFQPMIRDTRQEISPDAPLKIEEFYYKGKVVYLFTAQCCDQLNMLYDPDCNMICAPSGGFTGLGDRKCEDFDDSARLIRKLWEHPGKK